MIRINFSTYGVKYLEQQLAYSTEYISFTDRKVEMNLFHPQTILMTDIRLFACDKKTTTRKCLSQHLNSS